MKNFLALLSLALPVCSCSAVGPDVNSAPADHSVDPHGSEAVLPDPILASRGWTASVVESGEESRLTVSGEIDLPSPGWEVDWKAGALDRANPPGLRIELILTPPSEPVIQSLTPTAVAIEMISVAPRYREIILHVGGAPLEAIRMVEEGTPKRK